jgi:prolyl oligopeptidase
VRLHLGLHRVQTLLDIHQQGHLVSGQAGQDLELFLGELVDRETRLAQAGQRIRERAAEFDRATAGWTHRDHFATEIERLAQVNSPVSTPRPAGGRLFVEWHPTGAEHPAIAVIEPGGTLRTLLDPHRLDPTGRTTLETWHPSTEGRLLAYQVAAGGTENAQLWVLDVGTGTVVDGPISRVRNSTVAWLPGGRAFYYVRRPDPADRRGEGQYHRRVRLHRIGADPDRDPVVFGEGRRATEHYAVRTDPDGRWLVVSASAGTDPRKDLWIADLRSSHPAAPQFRVMHEGIDARTRPNPRPDGIYALTDLGADRNRLVRCTPGAPEPRSWTDLVPEDPDAVLDDYAVLDHPGLPRPLLLVRRVRHAVGELTVHDLRNGTLPNVVALPGNCSIGQLRAEAAAANAAWFGVTGFDHPTTVYRFDAHTGLAAPWTPPGGIETHDAQTPDGPPIRTRQLTYPSADGTPVRLFVVAADPHDPQTPRPPVPTILMAYGGFGQSTTPSHAPDVAAWVRAGGVYAIAAVRGGGEEGRAWHRAGLLAGKQTSIDDLNAAAQHLVDLGLTTSGQLGVWGASNGGLLAGGALTQHPERYGAVACVAALLDMVRYQQSGLGPSWVGEYGDAADPEQLAGLRAYSPYHWVREGQAYPAVLLAVFEADTRVDPLHARKMGEALRRAGSGSRPVLLRSEAHAGHGTRSRSRLTALQADLLASFAHELGLRSPARGSSPDQQGDHEVS